MSKDKPAVSHADVAFVSQCGNTEQFWIDAKEAKANLDFVYPDNDRNPELAKRLASMMLSERSRRQAHYHRYRLMTKVAAGQPLFTNVDNYPVASMLDLSIRTTGMTDDELEYAKVYEGKGIAAELGHVDQLGDWESGRELDAQIRALPAASELSSQGFMFDETYATRESAKINYEFYMTEGGLKGTRKRAAADVRTESGELYDLIKTSSFLIDQISLDPEQLTAMRRVKRLSESEDSNKRDDAFAEAGEIIIEPLIAERERRTQTTSVLAVASIYFALHRFK